MSNRHHTTQLWLLSQSAWLIEGFYRPAATCLPIQLKHPMIPSFDKHNKLWYMWSHAPGITVIVLKFPPISMQESLVSGFAVFSFTSSISKLGEVCTQILQFRKKLLWLYPINSLQNGVGSTLSNISDHHLTKKWIIPLWIFLCVILCLCLGYGAWFMLIEHFSCTNLVQSY